MMRTEYHTAETKFSREDVESILKGAAGANKALATVTWSDDSWTICTVTEKVMSGFGSIGEQAVDDRLIELTIHQLDQWSGSKSSGDAMATRAATVIRHLMSKLQEQDK